MRTLGTNKKKLLKKNLKKLIMFNIKNRMVNKVSLVQTIKLKLMKF